MSTQNSDCIFPVKFHPFAIDSLAVCTKPSSRRRRRRRFKTQYNGALERIKYDDDEWWIWNVMAKAKTKKEIHTQTPSQLVGLERERSPVSLFLPVAWMCTVRRTALALLSSVAPFPSTCRSDSSRVHSVSHSLALSGQWVCVRAATVVILLLREFLNRVLQNMYRGVRRPASAKVFIHCICMAWLSVGLMYEYQLCVSDKAYCESTATGARTYTEYDYYLQ